MTTEQLVKNLEVPKGKIDVILDTDAYNEIDDQFAISYMLKNQDKLNIKAILAAPFLNDKSESPKDGMEKSYNEILKLLSLADMNEFKEKTYRGSEKFLENEKTPVESDASEYIVNLAKNYSPEKPLYIVAIGAITNVASAFIKAPEIAENTVVVWLGGTALHWTDSREFNMFQDVAAARVVMGSDCAFVQLPCAGVVSAFTISKPELMYWFHGKNKLATYLAENSIKEADSYALNKPWTRVIWDVTAVAWLLNENDKFMNSYLTPTPIPEYDDHYGINPKNKLMRYVYNINRDRLMEDLIKKITE